MIDEPLADIEAWLLLFSNNSLPVLRITKRRIDAMRDDLDNVDTRELAHVILQDPIMTARVLAYIQPFHGRSLQQDITTIAGAIMMSGIYPFFKRFDVLPTIEEGQQGHDPRALLGILQIIRRAQRAAAYAHDWALRRHDIGLEEVRVAALLHDLAEVLVWCFAPKLGLQIHDLMVKHPGMRSADAQTQVLGFSFFELQQELCRLWHLPELLLHLMDDQNAAQPRVRNVSLAVRLARHSASGWEDPALPDDFTDICELLNITPNALRAQLGLDPVEEAAGTDDTAAGEATEGEAAPETPQPQ